MGIKTSREVRLEQTLLVMGTHAENIDRQLKKLEDDVFNGGFTQSDTIDYINQMRSITSQIKYESEGGDNG